ncbi:MAG: Holliday junction resolvase RuvX [Clostridia bacterium]|nr:Holliday junction resolvase RuvX [Clostridia bacterium]
MTRVCAIDYGRTRTGVAFSDLLRSGAGESVVITEKDDLRLVEKITTLLKEKQVTEVAVGMPVNMDGTVGPQGEKCRRFADLLAKHAEVTVTFIDERRTTIDAHRILSENGVFRQKRKETVDAVAATLILEIFLKRLQNGVNA